jgi:ribosomal protein L17
VVRPEAAVPAEDPDAKPATTRQKAEILLLLNNEMITTAEKEKMVSNINKLDTERADKAIAKLKKTIADRQSGAAA